MHFDPVVTNPNRLRILTALFSTPVQEFTLLRQTTRLTDGNLASHARRLQSAGLISIHKDFRDNKPHTTYHLTDAGRKALQSHTRELMDAVAPASTQPLDTPLPSDSEEWVD